MQEPLPIVTGRLRLELMRPETLAALLEKDKTAAEQAQGFALSDEFVASLDAHFLKIQLGRMRARPSQRAWCARAIVRSKDGALIGNCGFHGPPADVGRAEIGYTVLPDFRRMGYATEAAQGLVDWAKDQGEHVVFASVSPTNVASLALVKRLGFRKTGGQFDEIDGEEDVFEIDL